MREAPLAGHLEARLDEAADDVLAHEVRLLRDLIGCQTVSSPEPTDAFKGEAERALDLLEPALRGPLVASLTVLRAGGRFRLQLAQMPERDRG
jgi:hypothetical protein